MQRSRRRRLLRGDASHSRALFHRHITRPLRCRGGPSTPAAT